MKLACQRHVPQSVAAFSVIAGALSEVAAQITILSEGEGLDEDEGQPACNVVVNAAMDWCAGTGGRGFPRRCGQAR